MKIIRNGRTSARPRNVSAQRREETARSSDAYIRSTDAGTLARMLVVIDEFRAGDKELAALVNELEYHLQSLGRAGQGWRQAFFGHWRDLDRALAEHVGSGEQVIGTAARRRIEMALRALRHLIEGKLGRKDGA